MSSNKNTARILGSLFLLVMVSWSVGFGLSGAILHAPGYLADIYPDRTRIFFGVVFELVDVAAIIGIIVIMFSMIKEYSLRLAVWYLSFRVVEIMLLIIGVLCALALITVSQEFVKAGSGDQGHVKIIGTILLMMKDRWVHLILPFFYSLAAFGFYYFFFKTKLIPRFICCWAFG